MSAMSKQAMTEAEYLEFERASEIKHEYLNGKIYAVAGASDPHNLICAHVLIRLGIQLQEAPCEVIPGDMRLKIAATGLYTYPDVSVVCGEVQMADGEFDTLLNPVLIIEVLSPSTESYDRGKKFHHYQQLESLQEYVLIAQDSPRIERFLRQDDGTWVLTNVTDMHGNLQLASINAALALADVYEQVTFKPEGEGSDNHTEQTAAQ